MDLVGHARELIQNFLRDRHRVLKQGVLLLKSDVAVVSDRIRSRHLLLRPVLIVVRLPVLLRSVLGDELRHVLHGHGRVHRTMHRIHIWSVALHALMSFLSRGESDIFECQVLVRAPGVDVLLIDSSI